MTDEDHGDEMSYRPPAARRLAKAGAVDTLAEEASRRWAAATANPNGGAPVAAPVSMPPPPDVQAVTVTVGCSGSLRDPPMASVDERVFRGGRGRGGGGGIRDPHVIANINMLRESLVEVTRASGNDEMTPYGVVSGSLTSIPSLQRGRGFQPYNQRSIAAPQAVCLPTVRVTALEPTQGTSLPSGGVNQ